MAFYYYKYSPGVSIRRLRDALGWTQAQVAQKADIPPAAISHFESNRRRPSFKNLLRLADALDVSLDKLVGRERIT